MLKVTRMTCTGPKQVEQGCNCTPAGSSWIQDPGVSTWASAPPRACHMGAMASTQAQITSYWPLCPRSYTQVLKQIKAQLALQVGATSSFLIECGISINVMLINNYPRPAWFQLLDGVRRTESRVWHASSELQHFPHHFSKQMHTCLFI
eukprot:scaffold142982_cov17-Tisochrysis_lutea.AAC.2